VKAPFPYFGGKSRVAQAVWKAFGENVPNYIEPFCGSCAVLLARPGGPGKIETVNDGCSYICNFWRSIKHNPQKTAEWCDWPVSELDLHARHAWLIKQSIDLREKLRADPDYHDAKIAGWWVWGICQWIGGGWCKTPYQQRPHLHDGDRGVNAAEKQLKQQIPGIHASGVHSFGTRLPAIGNDRALNGLTASPALEWFQMLSQRLRRVRLVHGDWTRVLGSSTLGKGRNVGGRRPTAVFLDAPYDDELRDPGLYTEDTKNLSVKVRIWALEHGDDPDLRIALCGLASEHDGHMPATWRVHRWTGASGYSRGKNRSRTRHEETIWFSPHCLHAEMDETLSALHNFDSISEASDS
jgi:hypothetical protein